MFQSRRLGQYCSATGHEHPPDITFCVDCGAGRAVPPVHVDLTTIEPTARRLATPRSTTPRTATPRARPSQDHLNAANTKQQSRERDTVSQQQSSNAGSTALSQRTDSPKPPRQDATKRLSINTHLYKGTWSWMDKQLSIKAPGEVKHVGM